MTGSENLINKKDYKILVVDDQIEVVEAIVPILEMQGYKAIGSQSGLEAINIVKNDKIDLILLDYFMPKMTGEQVVSAIREFNSEVVIILQTGYAGEKPPQKMLETLSIQGYHDKTEGPEKLLVWVASGIRTAALLRENKRALEGVDFARDTLKSMMQDKARASELAKLTALQELAKAISRNFSLTLLSLSEGLKELGELSFDYKNSINNMNVAKSSHYDLAEKMNKKIESLKSGSSFLINSLSAMMERIIKFNLQSKDAFTVEELIDKVENMAKEDTNFAHCKLYTDISVPLTTVLKGSINNFALILYNVILNSAQSYGNRNGEVDLKILKNYRDIEFVVQDFGTGISPEANGKLFKEFVSTKEKNGLGLGLYASYASIKANFGGDIWFSSETGKGTEFHIQIPAE